MGVLSEEIRNLNKFNRTNHPVYSFIAIGKFQKNFIQIDNFEAFSKESPFGLMLEIGTKIVSWNLPDQNSMTFYHFIERENSVDYRFDKASDIANVIKNKDELSLKGSVLICNPVPKKYSIPNNIIEKAINSSMLKARQNKIHGKKLTPFLLEKVSSITKGKTLETNIQLMLNNAKLAARIAFALNK